MLRGISAKRLPCSQDQMRVDVSGVCSEEQTRFARVLILESDNVF